jgi:hypothetical protein
VGGKREQALAMKDCESQRVGANILTLIHHNPLFIKCTFSFVFISSISRSIFSSKFSIKELRISPCYVSISSGIL